MLPYPPLTVPFVAAMLRNHASLALADSTLDRSAHETTN
jgi:hypothetical protein